MKTYIRIGYRGLLFEGVPENFFTSLAHAQLVEEEGYGPERTFSLDDRTKLEIEFISDEIKWKPKGVK